MNFVGQSTEKNLTSDFCQGVIAERIASAKESPIREKSSLKVTNEMSQAISNLLRASVNQTMTEIYRNTKDMIEYCGIEPAHVDTAISASMYDMEQAIKEQTKQITQAKEDRILIVAPSDVAKVFSIIHKTKNGTQLYNDYLLAGASVDVLRTLFGVRSSEVTADRKKLNCEVPNTRVRRRIDPYEDYYLEIMKAYIGLRDTQTDARHIMLNVASQTGESINEVVRTVAHAENFDYLEKEED